MAFGVETKGVDNAKAMIYPQGGAQPNSDEISAMYRHTHGNFAPGE